MPEALFNKKKETVTRVFSYKFCEISKTSGQLLLYTYFRYMITRKVCIDVMKEMEIIQVYEKSDNTLKAVELVPYPVLQKF